jgi:hydroxymethylglutaryl-CoA lyase
MAATPEVLAGLDYRGGHNFAVLVPNMVGWSGYLAATADLPRVPGEVAVFISASEGFSRANLNCSVAESLDRIAPVVEAATRAGVVVRGYVSCVTDCPFDGEVAPEAVARAVAALRGLAPMQVSLGDTIGKGTPHTVERMLDAVIGVAPAGELAGHFHDTGGRALANVEVSLQAGIRCFDAAVGGLGGCPYAPGAPGNLATEALVARLEGLGLETGVDVVALNEAAGLAKKMRAKQ